MEWEPNESNYTILDTPIEGDSCPDSDKKKLYVKTHNQIWDKEDCFIKYELCSSIKENPGEPDHGNCTQPDLLDPTGTGNKVKFKSGLNDSNVLFASENAHEELLINQKEPVSLYEVILKITQPDYTWLPVPI